ncbi:Bacteroidetes-specific putative membrane protein [Cesiribacter andamanensis AMV16]|uniref:Bacteroidetes-specific putative membrane protein n=1 Tax=Cesiribacter andamanensis AMV16 TaxID=1279009 RepID=M7N147_9BACT|nr:Bacteroidetes-specific putative membrane protein [Cesiribacter andamanensis AMV16]
MLLGSTGVVAQYTTPTSFWLSPQLTAPTAMSAYGYKQISAHYQKQALAANFGARSMLLSGQFPLYGQRNTPFGTLGLNVLRQENGSAYLMATSGALLSYNYTVRLAGQHHLVGGVQGGYFSRGLDWSRATTSNQVEGGQINPGLDHGERFFDYKSSAFTTNVGLAYYLTDARGQQQFHLGAGLINANKGRFTYLETDENQAEPQRLVVYSQLRLISTPFYELGTHLFWQQQSGFGDLVGGLQLNKGINPRKPVAEEYLGLGIYYSPDQSATFAMQLVRNQLLLGLSYSTPFGDRGLQGLQNTAEATIGWRVHRAASPRPHYGGSNRINSPAFKAHTGPAVKKNRIATSYKKKLNRKAGKTFQPRAGKKTVAGRKNTFTRKVTSYKAKAGKKRPAIKMGKQQSNLAKKYRKAQKATAKKLKKLNKKNRKQRSFRRGW